MITALTTTLALLCLALVGLALWLAVRLQKLRFENMELDHRCQQQQQRMQQQQEQEEQFATRLDSLCLQTLQRNSESFLQLAEENLKKHHKEADAAFDMREKSLEGILKPMHQSLRDTHEQIRRIENERKQSYGSLSEQIRQLGAFGVRLETETHRLRQALQNPQGRGRWGELSLRRVVELAGMVNRCDFYEQYSSQEDDVRQRPDMLVSLPNKRFLVIDSKTPLSAYLNAYEASDEKSRNAALDNHAQNVSRHIQSLSSKAYWQQFKEKSPDFVLLFIPGEAFLSAALERRPELQEQALEKNVLLATPNILIAILKSVALTWRQEDSARNAEQISHLAQEFHERLRIFLDLLQRLGRNQSNSVDLYNRALSSLNSRLLPTVDRMRALGGGVAKPLPNTPVIESQVKSIEQFPRIAEHLPKE